MGRALILAVYDKAERAGSPRVYWQTHETNEQAMLLYDEVAARSGFLPHRTQLRSRALPRTKPASIARSGVFDSLTDT